jgi:V8-like Glu-specific endopeptidase
MKNTRSSHPRLLALGLAFSALIAHGLGAAAQTVLSVKEQEEAEIRAELLSVIQEGGADAADAQKALDALNQPETSAQGRLARNRRERGSRRIVNGIVSRGYPAVGALLGGNDPKQAGALCTGTLVGCNKFLTAAHCIAKNPDPKAYLVFFQDLGFFKITAIAWEPDKYRFPYFDLAMLTLETPAEGIEPMPINMSVKPLNNFVATIVGFGRTGGTNYDYGIKREGTVKFSACPANLAKSRVLCWRYDADARSNRSAQNTCHADSGGGIFIRDDDGPHRVEKLFGVVSGGTDNEYCKHKDLAYNVDVYEYRDWIKAAGEGRLTASVCGVPLSQKASRAPLPLKVRLSSSHVSERFSLQIPEGTGELRFSMNAEDDSTGKNEFAFSASAPGASGQHVACADEGSGRQFAFCSIKKPIPGEWTISVNLKKGAGDIQVTALSVAGDR